MSPAAAHSSDDRRLRGGILLVSCYELGHQPLGLAVPAGVLERAGFSPDTLDLAVERFDDQKVATYSLIAISTPYHTALRLGVRVARRVRALNPGAHICFYGLYAQLHDGVLRGSVADTCLGAEFERGLVELARRLLGDPSGDDGGESSARAREPFDRTPSRRALPPRSLYVKLDDGVCVRDVGSTTTTRGCKHTCRHCPITPAYGGRFRAIPVEDVLRDVAALARDGATHITFADPDFLNGPGHARRVTRLMHEAFPSLTFDYTAKVEHLARQRRLVDELHELGNLFVVTAIESLNDRVLYHLGKNHTRQDAIDVCRFFRQRGLALRPTFLPFTPWESLDSFIDMLDTIEREDLVESVDPVQYSIRLLLPGGSPLVGSEAMRPYLGGFDAERFTHAWRHPDDRMDRLQAEVANVVEGAAAAGRDAAEAFDAVRRSAYVARDGVSPTPFGARNTRPPGRVPRLTEAWFC